MNSRYFYLILLVALLFSSTEVVMKGVDHLINPIQMNFLRFTLGGVVLLPWAFYQLKKRRYRLTVRDWKIFSLAGVLCVIICMTLYNVSIFLISASLAAILFACNAFFTILFGWLLLKEPLAKAGILGLALCFVGVLIIINPLANASSLSQGFGGIMIGVLCAVCYGLYNTLTKVMTGGQAISGVVLTCFSFVIGGLLLGGLMFLSYIPAVAHFLRAHNMAIFACIPWFANINQQTILPLLIVSTLNSGIGFALFYIAMTQLNVALASLVYFLKPVLSPIVAFLLLGERAPLAEVIGVGVMLIGSGCIFASQWRGTRQEGYLAVNRAISSGPARVRMKP